MVNSAPNYSNAEALDLVRQINDGIKPLGGTLAKKAKTAAEEIRLLATLRKDLDAGTGLGEVLKKMDQAGYEGITTNANTTEQSFRKALETKLNLAIDYVKEAEFFEAIKKNAASLTPKEEKSASFTQKLFGEEGSIAGALEKHKTKMASRTPSQRMAISLGQVGLGMIGIAMGPHMIQQALHGVKRKKEFVTDVDGNKQLAGVAIVPIGTGEKAFKILGGTAIAGAGITSLVLGFSNFGRDVH